MLKVIGKIRVRKVKATECGSKLILLVNWRCKKKLEFLTFDQKKMKSIEFTPFLPSVL